MTKKLTKQNLINFLLLCVITGNLLSVIIPNLTKYTSFDYWKRYDQLKYTYENSQYVQKNPKVGWIPDEFVFSYAAGAYVKGVNPILIDSELAPLGKYLIGLSIILTGNENIIIIICAVLSLYLMYLIGKQVFLNSTLALIPSMFLSFETIFKNQLIYVPLFDIIQLPFLLASLYFFNKGMNRASKHRLLNFILANISLGGFISVKFFVTGFIIIATWLVVIILRKDKQALKFLLISLPFSLFVLIASYFKIFIDGYTLRQFFGIQKWIFLYHQSKLIMPFTIWPLIYFNKWYVWYGDKPIISDGQWTVMWPIIQTISLLTIILYVLNKIKKRREIEVVMIWSLLYILFVSFGNASSRYLVIYIPILYIVSLYGFTELTKILLKKLKTKVNYGTIKT